MSRDQQGPSQLPPNPALVPLIQASSARPASIVLPSPQIPPDLTSSGVWPLPLQSDGRSDFGVLIVQLIQLDEWISLHCLRMRVACESQIVCAVVTGVTGSTALVVITCCCALFP